MRSLLMFVAGAMIGLLAACYVFILNGYQTEFVPPQSDRWYQLIREGRLPEPLTLQNTEIRSNGYILEVFGTITNPRSSVAQQKISADLFDSSGRFIHKCERWIPVIAPNSQYNFRFHCTNLEDLKAGSYASGKVYIDG